MVLKKPNLFFVSGGVGKHLQFTALFSKLVKKYDQKLVINSAYPELFKYCPEVADSKMAERDGMIFDIFHTYYDKYDQIFSRDPYGGSFLKGKTHIVKDWASQYEIDVEDVRPSFQFNPIREKILLPTIQKVNRFILVQVTGGQGIELNTQYDLENKGRNYNHGQELINLLNEAFPGYLIIVFSHNNERQEFTGETKINDEKGLPLFQTREDFMILAAHCSFFISIDSALYHICSNKYLNKKGIGLWGTTSPKRFGYKENINVQSEYPYCVEIEPQVIIDKALKLNAEEKIIEVPQGYGESGWANAPSDFIIGKRKIK